VRVAAVRSLLEEARSAHRVLEDESDPRPFHSVVVSGVLAEQLAKELGAGASPGSVQVSLGPVPETEVVVRVIAGEPTAEDEGVVREAERRGVDVVLVQLWPQAEWSRPYVLSPFVVECRAGEGFPIREIADRIVEAADDARIVAADVPTLRESVERSIVRRTVVRAALLGVSSSRRARPLITLEQVRMVLRLDALGRPCGPPDEAVQTRLRAAAGIVFASGFAFQRVARSARQVLPAPLVNGVVAGAGTWAVARAARTLAARLG
jgi:hypothetical protein